MKRHLVSFLRHNTFLGPVATAVLGIAACADSPGAPGDLESDSVALRGLASTGDDPGDAGRRDAGSDAVADVRDGEGAVCTAIAAPARASLPHVVSGGAQAKAVVSALGELLGAQQPPVAEGTNRYAMQAISCSTLFTPTAGGSDCSLDVSIDGGASVAVETRDPALAASLLSALVDAGADQCSDFAHGEFLRLSKVTIDIASGTVEFDDASKYSLPASPNVRAGGPEAALVAAAIEAASINDCDPSRTVFVVCNKFSESPACSTTFFPLEDVGGSELVYTCSPQPAVGPTVQLGAPEALTLWNAMVGAAAVSGFTPLHGTIEQATIINARYFTWDRASVGFLLTADNPRPPPSPGQ